MYKININIKGVLKMITFDKKIIFTGAVERTSKKTQNKYTLVNFLGESGESFSALADSITQDVFLSLNQLDEVIASFQLNKFNNSLNIKVTNLVKA